MKDQERKSARRLRAQGFSMNEIYRRLGVSKGSVSLWVTDIQLTPEQKQQLSEKGQKKEVVERRRTTRLARENARRQTIINEAKKDIRGISSRELFVLGVGLYWAEGGKTQRGLVRFSNSDPLLIQIMMRFFDTICKVPKTKFRGHVHLHPHLSARTAAEYWHKISKIPLNQFFKTSQQHNKASQNKKDSLPYGTFTIYVCNTELFLRIKGWMEGIYKGVIEK
jgi:hypothetical protein